MDALIRRGFRVGSKPERGARHPIEVLKFFGVQPHHTVVEILPGSTGHYLEILAPYLRDKGRYIAANRDETAPTNYIADHQRLLQ